MVVYTTEFPASEIGTIPGLLGCCRDWILGSPFYPWTTADTLTCMPNEAANFERDGHRVAFGWIDLGGIELAGVQYTWAEAGKRRWTTQIVGRHDSVGLWVSVRLSCELVVLGLKLPSAKKPYFLKNLLAKLGGGMDGDFRVQDLPHYLGESQLSIAQDIVEGKATSLLPIAYVSVGIDGKHFVDVEKVARWLSCMAHVVVEPSREFSVSLSGLVGRNNVYGGAVGVYWPQSDGAHRRLLSQRYETSKDLELELQALVRTALTYTRPARSTTWAELQDALAVQRMKALKLRGDATLEEYVQAFDAESASLHGQLTSLHQESERLRQAVLRHESSRPGILNSGSEQDIYPHELLDVVHRCLFDACHNSAEGSRRRAILDALLRVNQRTSRAEELEESIKSILSSTDRIGATEIDSLRKLGFVVEDGGKHYKATFGGDRRLSFTLFKTASDHRAGKNLAAEIVRTLFK